MIIPLLSIDLERGREINGGCPLVISYVAIENGHRNRKLSRLQWCRSMVLFVYQIVNSQMKLDGYDHSFAVNHD